MSEALALMQEATQNMMVDQATPAMHKITMGYNLARLQEASGAARSWVGQACKWDQCIIW